MQAVIDQERLSSLHERLQRSREEIFDLAHLMGDDPVARRPSAEASAFPRSHVMRALMGEPGRMLIGGAAVATTLLRPKLLWAAVRLMPALRPILWRYVLPRLLGQR